MKTVNGIKRGLEFIMALLIFSLLVFMAYSAEKEILNNIREGNEVRNTMHR